MPPESAKPVERETVGVIQGKHHVSACADCDSLWVEIAGPKGGAPWQMTPSIARGLARLLAEAAERAEASGRPR